MDCLAHTPSTDLSTGSAQGHAARDVIRLWAWLACLMNRQYPMRADELSGASGILYSSTDLAWGRDDRREPVFRFLVYLKGKTTPEVIFADEYIKDDSFVDFLEGKKIKTSILAMHVLRIDRLDLVA
jgi:hypothetical protein